MIPLREIPSEQLLNLETTLAIRPISLQDFRMSLRSNAPSVSHETMQMFDEWRRSKGQI